MTELDKEICASKKGTSPYLSSEISKFRSILDSVTRQEGEWTEFAVEKDKPMMMRRTEEGDFVVRISVAPTESTPAISYEPKQRVSPGRVELADVKDLISDIDVHALTTEEIAERLRCSKTVTERYLEELYERGEIDRRESGQTTLWWETKRKQNLLQGFGAFEDSDLPEQMKEERKKARQSWENDDTMLR